jgi:hypothetical protein
VNLAGQPIGPPEVIVPAQVYGISDDMKHPRTDEFNVSYEQQLMRGMRLTVTGIWRWETNFVNNVIADARWSPRTLTNQLTGQTFTAYAWSNQQASSDSFAIRNPEGFEYVQDNGSIIATLDPHRNYKGLMFVLSNSLRGNFGYQFSYVLAKAEGNVDNSGFGNNRSGTFFTSPNTALINTEGELTHSRRHEIKAYFTYRLPKIDVMLGGNYTGLSGTPWTANALYSNSALPTGGSARRIILLEPRGTERNDFRHQVDLRVEKAFQVQGNRFGVYADMINLFNTNTVLTRQARYPNTTIAGETVLFKAPLTIQGARQVTFGLRWAF